MHGQSKKLHFELSCLDFNMWFVRMVSYWTPLLIWESNTNLLWGFSNSSWVQLDEVWERLQVIWRHSWYCTWLWLETPRFDQNPLEMVTGSGREMCFPILIPDLQNNPNICLYLCLRSRSGDMARQSWWGVVPISVTIPTIISIINKISIS